MSDQKTLLGSANFHKNMTRLFTCLNNFHVEIMWWRLTAFYLSRLGRRGSEVANPFGPDGGCADAQCGPSPTTKFNPGSRHVEEGCQTACWSVRMYFVRPARPRSVHVRQISGAAGCDRVRRTGIDPLGNASLPPWGGTEPEVQFHGHQCGVHVRNISHRCERSRTHGEPHQRYDLMRHPGVVGVWRSARTGAQYGLWGVRVAEASHPGPARMRRRTQRLWALQRSWDSDGELSSNEILRGPAQVDTDSEVERPLPRASCR